MKRDPNNVISPKARTPMVCVSAIVRPSDSACLTVPFAPTKYAATNVLPWPGSRAWIAPNPSARRSDKSSTGNVRSWVSMSDANPAPARSGALCGAEIAAVTTGAGAPPRASNDIFASRTSSGLERRSAGYAVSSWLTSSVEAVEFSTATPSAGWTTISFQPIRSE